MNEAEQELYEAPAVIYQTSGFLLLERLPTGLPDQPLIYLSDSKELPKPTKSAILGEVKLIMHIYGTLSERQQISTIKGTISRQTAGNLKRAAHFNQDIKHQEVKTQMIRDTKQMKKTIWHTVLSLYMQFYQEELSMGEVMQRKGRILLVRRLDETTTRKAMKPLFQIEREWEFSCESSGTQTKDSVANAVSGLRVTLSLDGLASRDGESLCMEDAIEDSVLMGSWDVDLKDEKNTEGKYPAIYAQGYISSWSLSTNVEELIKIKTEASINGKPQDGFAAAEADIITEAQHTFQDTVPDKAP